MNTARTPRDCRTVSTFAKSDVHRSPDDSVRLGDDVCVARFVGIHRLLCLAFHLRVVLFEEPWLARTHGAAWDAYRARVPRWLFPRPR